MKTRRTGTLVSHGAGAALVGPATVAAAAARGLRAAPDVVGRPGASVGNRCSTCCGALGRGNAYAGSAIGAGTRTVDRGAFVHDRGLDGADADKGGDGDDGGVTHLGGGFGRRW